MVGESNLAWKLRDDIAFIAGAAGHILVLGESGVGKEVVAHAIHGFSTRGRASWLPAAPRRFRTRSSTPSSSATSETTRTRVCETGLV
jgi:transcriptional regulator of aromatic amino acid metabolism